MDPQTAYAELLRRCREDAYLSSAADLLAWDEETYMPHGAAEYRAAQMAHLAGLLHDRGTDPRVGELLAAVEGSPLAADPDSPEAVNVRHLRLAFDRNGHLESELVAETARVTTLAQQAWADARAQSDYTVFRPWLAKILALKKDEADAYGYACPYDGLLAVYDPGATAADLTSLFATLRRDLVPLAAALADSPRRPSADVLYRHFSADRQRTLFETLAAAVGFDFDRGRLDPTPRPFFATVGPSDVRVAARFDEHDFGGGFLGMLHEVGHGLYEQGLDRDRYGEPVAESPSAALHESQARLWENLVGRSRGFWEYAFPIARRVFPGPFADATAAAVHGAFHRVSPSPLRVGADEVTYNLHVLIRFELEQGLLSGDLPVADLPAAWTEAYRTVLGIVPENDVEGCLQDSHWSAGMFGYFPAYTLGNVYADQLFARAEADCGGFGPAFAAGDFSGLLGWLRANVHRAGSRDDAPELVRRLTGRRPDPDPLVRRLRGAYSALYGL